MLGIFRRRRRLLLASACCLSLFVLSLLSAGGELGTLEEHQLESSARSSDDVGTWPTGEDGARRGNGGFYIRGANATGNGVVVQLWPKNSLNLIENAYRLSAKKNAERIEQTESRKLRLSGQVQKVKSHGVVEKPVSISEDLVPCSLGNADCLRLRKLLFHSWPVDKPRAAFYLLTQPRRLHYIQMVLASIDTYFNKRFHYPIIVFHEADLIPVIPKIRNLTTSDLYFQEIAFSVPDFLKQPIATDIPCSSPIGYRHMCRFHAKGVFQHPIMRGLEYYWRLDDDSLLLNHVQYDVFRFMRDRQILYGYSWQHWDSKACTTGLWQATRTYINRTHIKPYFFDEWKDPQLYYNNFEISKMSLWLSSDYARFIEYVDRLGGMFYHRWGDAPIKSIAVSLFVPKIQVYQFKDVGYKHGSYVNQITPVVPAISH